MREKCAMKKRSQQERLTQPSHISLTPIREMVACARTKPLEIVYSIRSFSTSRLKSGRVDPKSTQIPFLIKSCGLIPWRKLAFDLFLLAFLVSVPFLRVGLDGVIRPLDSDFPLYPKDQLYRYSYTWFESGALFGNDGSFTSLSQAPYYLTPASLSYIGLPINIVNRLTLISYGTLVAWSAYIMAYLLIPDQRRFTPILTGLLFFYNPYIIGELNLGHWFSILSYSALPIMLVATIKGLNEVRWGKWALILGITSTLTIPRIRLFPIILEVLCIYLLFWLLQKRSWSKLVHSLKFITVVSCAVLTFNMWWILPTLANLDSVYSLLVTPPSTSFLAFSFPTTFLTNLSFFHIIGLVGYGIPLDQSYGGYFQSPLYLLIELVLIMSIFLVLILRRNHFVNFFAIISVLSLGFITSITYVKPIYSLYEWLSTNSPSPINFLLFPMGFEYRGIVIALAYAFLLGAGYTEVFRKERLHKARRLFSRSRNRIFSFFSEREIWSKFFGIFLIVLILANSWPLFGGVKADFLEPVIVPRYYDEARQWLINQNSDYKILSVPHPYWIYYVKTPWAFNGTKDITDVIQQVFPVPILSSKPGFGYAKGDSELLNMVYSTLPDYSSQWLISLLGGKYIVVRNDVIDSSFNVSHFENQTNLILEKSIGDLNFYRNPSYSPTVYASASLYPIWGGVESLIPLAYVNGFQWNCSAFISLINLSPEDRSFWLSHSKELIVYNASIEDEPTISKINEKGIAISYLFNWTFPRYTKIIRDGMYMLNTTTTSNQKSEIKILNLTQDAKFSNPHFNSSLSFNSVSIGGTSNKNDSVIVEESNLLSDCTIKWKLFPEPGWHALYININRTEWDLGRLALDNGAIALWIKGDQSGREIRFSFMSAEESRFVWPPQTLYLNWSGWKEILLPLNQFETVGALNWSDPWSLWIWQKISIENTGFSETHISNITRLFGPRISVLRPNESQVSVVLPEPRIETNKKSPTEYQVRVHTKNPFFLILNGAYNDGWKAFVNGKELHHFLASFYANGYYVPNIGNFSIRIVYRGQQHFEVGAFITVSSLVFFGFYVTGILSCLLAIVRVHMHRIIARSKTLYRRFQLKICLSAKGARNGQQLMTKTRPKIKKTVIEHK